MTDRVFECRCGCVRLRARGAPIVGVTCHCADCLSANRALQSMSSSSSTDDDGGTRAILYRNDRVHLVCGREHLQQYRLTPDAPTRRVVAQCCASPMFLDYEAGFWLSVYRARTVISDTEIPPKTPGLGFIAKLMQTFVALGFRRPPLDPMLQHLDERLLPAPQP